MRWSTWPRPCERRRRTRRLYGGSRRAGGVSRPLVYKHFANRHELLAAVYRREAVRLHDELAAEVTDAGTVEEMFRALVRGSLRAAAERGQVFTALRAAGAWSRELREEQRDPGPRHGAGVRRPVGSPVRPGPPAGHVAHGRAPRSARPSAPPVAAPPDRGERGPPRARLHDHGHRAPMRRCAPRPMYRRRWLAVGPEALRACAENYLSDDECTV